MADISFNTACKALKIAQIAQLNQLFQLLHYAHIYGHGFYEVFHMLMGKNVNNDVSKDSPIQKGYNLLIVLPAPGYNIVTLLAKAFSKPLSFNQRNEVKVVPI